MISFVVFLHGESLLDWIPLTLAFERRRLRLPRTSYA